MTTALSTLGRQARSKRRVRLLTLIARASEELTALEVAEQRAHAHAIRAAEAAATTPLDPHLNTPGARIRQWARDQGLTIGDTGPIPKDVKRDYAAAHPTTQATP